MCNQKSFFIPLSLCPGTRAEAKIPGQTLLSRDVPRRPKCQFFFFFFLIIFFPLLFLLFLVSRLRTGLDRLSKSRPGQSRGKMSKFCSVPVHPLVKCQNPVPAVPWHDFELVPLSLCPGTMKKLLSLCLARQDCSIPLETLVSTNFSCPAPKFWQKLFKICKTSFQHLKWLT